jgi:signal transduction histidine kinase
LVVGVVFEPRVVFVQVAYGLLLDVYFAWLSISSIIKRPYGVQPLYSFAFLYPIAASASDMLGSFGLSPLPSLTSQAFINMALVVAGTLILNFIQIGRENMRLSVSLASANNELTAALREAQESTKLKSDLLTAVSHELRTPLNTIINVPEGLLEDFSPHGFRGDAEQVAHFLSIIRNSGRHLMDIVNDILDFSKLSASAFTLFLEPVNVGELFQTLAIGLKERAERRHIDFVVGKAPQVMVRGDSLRLKQVLDNLLNNAFKFSQESGRVELSGQVDGLDLVLTVRDEGIGIASENHRLIFDSFRQVDAGNTRRFGGTGLGLSIAKELVSLHGGTISVQSALGQGATFTVRVPLAGPRASVKASVGPSKAA